MAREIANNEYGYACRIANIKEAAKGNKVLSGCAVTANVTPDMFVNVAAGVVKINEARVTVSSVSNQAITVADGSNPRRDILEVGANGTVDYTAGTPAAIPYPPDLAEDHILLAVIEVPASDTTISSDQIKDSRMLEQGFGTQVPIGGIIPWMSNITGTPSLPTGWALCDGSTISDSDSPLDGQVIPDMNADNRFLRGSDTAGGTGGQETLDLQHTHGLSSSCSSAGVGAGCAGGYSAANALSNGTDIKPKYINVVWIIRIK